MHQDEFKYLLRTLDKILVNMLMAFKYMQDCHKDGNELFSESK